MEPSRFRVALLVKKVFDAILAKIPFLKKLDPDVVSGLSLISSLPTYIYLMVGPTVPAIVSLVIVLFLDVLDGVIARVKGQASLRGWIVDVSVDRVSEVLISLALGRLFTLVVVINIYLSLYSYRNKKHIILPIRQVLLLLLVIQYILTPGPLETLLYNVVFNF